MAPIMEKIAKKLHLHNKGSEELTSSTKTDAKTRVFDHEKVTVIFVLGGPGAGTLLSLFRQLFLMMSWLFNREGYSVLPTGSGL
jgi:hypothetical protein